jgi:hypothetical protein
MTTNRRRSPRPRRRRTHEVSSALPAETAVTRRRRPAASVADRSGRDSHETGWRIEGHNSVSIRRRGQTIHIVPVAVVEFIDGRKVPGAVSRRLPPIYPARRHAGFVRPRRA